MSSKVLSGIASESDLNESERVALIAFKKALNEALPKIIPEASGMQVSPDGNPADNSFSYLIENYVLNESLISLHPELQELKTLYAGLPENAKPIKVPEQITANAVASLSGSDLELAKFKQTLNEALPKIIPETAGMSLNINGDPLDDALAYLLDNYVLNESLISEKPELSELRDLYNKLPPDVLAKTETYKAFFVRPSTPDGLKNQEQAVVELAQRYLGTRGTPTDSEDGSTRINVQTSRALRDQLEKLQSSGEIDTELDPRVFDQSTVDALNGLVQKRMQAANVKPSALDGMLVNLWVLNNYGVVGSGTPSRSEMALGESISLRNMMNFMVNAELPSGATSSKPETDINWDTQWTNNDSGDRFFSSHTYRDLYNSKTVTTDVLFDRDSYSEENYNILLTAQEGLGIDMSRGRLMSEMEVGKLATEILSIKAKEAWCMISPGTEFDEKKIHEMIHAGQFMPHSDDLLLSEVGFGLPETEFFKEKLEEYGTDQSWRLEYEWRTAVLAYRSEKYAQRFGDIPQDAVIKKSEQQHGPALMRPGDVLTLEYEHIKHSYGLPSLYYGSPQALVVGEQRKTQYEIDRDAYLERYQKFKEDVGTCDPKPAATNESGDNSGPCTVEGVLRGDNSDPCTVEGVLRGDDFSKSATPDNTPCDNIGTNIEDTTGNKQGDCNVESEVHRRMDHTTEIRPNN